MRPVLRGMCSYESLKRTELDLCDLVIMNEAIDIENENQRLLTKAMPHG